MGMTRQGACFLMGGANVALRVPGLPRDPAPFDITAWPLESQMFACPSNSLSKWVDLMSTFQFPLWINLCKVAHES